MQQDEFRKWLVAQGQTEATASSRASSARRVEQYLGDLDELFAQEDRDSVLNRFAYTAEDERAERPNPSPVPIDGVLRTGLASLQQALKLYHSFLTEQSNVPDKAEHQALVDRLTRKEIEAAMQECDQLGLKAFLARGGFASPQVWVSDEGKDQTYPAKATVAAALGHLPDGRALAAKEFFNGFGEAQSFAKLEALGFQIIRKGTNGKDDAFTRERIEGAMDAYEEFRRSGAHADAFSSFGEPKDFWVRSSRPRQDKRFPTKPIVGYLLGKASNTFNGGWSQPGDAAARLHAAGYVIVDQHDTPLPLPDQHTHLMRGAERARLVALNYFIEPAREAGLSAVTIRAGDLHDMSGLVKNWANVCQALEGELFQKLASVLAPTRSGPERSTTTEYTFVLAQDGASKDEIMPHAVQTATTNLILYGPPGTGKTYQTAWEAVRLCLGDAVAADLSGENNRDRLMAEYRRLMTEKRIEFVTFHQSMSYEEFVEGLRPNTGQDGPDAVPDSTANAAGFRLKDEPGIFRTICARAERDSGENADANRLDRSRRIIRLGLTGTNWREKLDRAIREETVEWPHGGDVDWSPPEYDSWDAVKAKRQEEEPEIIGNHPTVYGTWLFRGAEPGDYVALTVGKGRIVAVGKLKGEYQFTLGVSGQPPRHSRAVEWLWHSIEGVSRAGIYGKDFTSFHTAYPLLEDQLTWDVLDTVIFGPKAMPQLEVARPFVLIIDEINRANISKVFGELITLLEPDKRLGRRDEIQLTLPYSKKRFGVPPNLHIIGTMNTADRSIALLDTALRRRFTFKELMPDPDILSPNVGGINLRELLKTINERIEYLFDREHQIGHAYFSGCKSAEEVEDVMRHKVIPLLAEYFYEEWTKVAAVLGDSPNAKAARFLEVIPWNKSVMIGDDFTGEKLRWRVKDAFDFSEFKA
ncbi:5-methylcytosine-specific restriction protein B [Cereibacter ovatus]|uniref:5-methylcytosine-specific restriction protein B n=1 Tax=Cereibacter ovatus TaxID=439529 RepID=A0A285D0I9_9RHOB|nr:AAA family ATPase [Cereibacter ovatus]SNX73185.1 5-methylcytosine-specific restriction protein B [Cereibacter ovatus]